MNRQSISKKMFGLVMIAVTLLLVACGGGDGDPTPTVTTAANEAAPTLPSNDSTADVLATEDISEEDITVVKPDIPGTAEDVNVAEVSSPATTLGTPTVALTNEATPPEILGTPMAPVTDLTGDTDGDAVASTPSATAGSTDPMTTDSTAISQSATAEIGIVEDSADSSPPAASAEGEIASTQGSATNTLPAATAVASPEPGQFNIPGDGTGGSGQPGEPSSNLPEDAPAASPVAGIAVEGCEVPNVPQFESDVTAYVTNAEVNFRSGPGTDCDQILEDPLAPDQAVDVIGGPVTQTVDDTVWLQIEVDGVPGWVSDDFVEPAE